MSVSYITMQCANGREIFEWLFHKFKYFEFMLEFFRIEKIVRKFCSFSKKSFERKNVSSLVPDINVDHKC